MDSGTAEESPGLFAETRLAAGLPRFRLLKDFDSSFFTRGGAQHELPGSL